MNLEWSAEELAFRDEVRAFLDGNLSAELRQAGRLMTSVYADHEASMEWQRILHERGWAAPAWPVEHGGCDWSLAQHYIFNRESRLAGAPPLSPMGIGMVAHALVAFGSDEQKAYFLPAILSGEVLFCQGYSEPESGSDLASLSMKAVDDGDDLVCTGSKIWITHATEANWIFCLVRTSRHAKRQLGITFLLIDLRTPGIDVRPLVMTSGEQIQNEVFFTDVRVPKANVIGRIDDGWTVAKHLLLFERGGSGGTAPMLQARLDALTEAAGDDAAFATRLAEARIRVDVLEIVEFRALSARSRGQDPGPASSMVKILGTELSQKLTELALEVAGPQGRAYQPHATAPGGPLAEFSPPDDGYVSGDTWQALAPLRYFNDRAGSIYAGTNEIQRNIIAKAALGL